MRRVIALAALALVLAGWVAATTLDALRGAPQSAIAGLGAVATAPGGALLLVRRPGNRMGIVLTAIAITSTIAGLGRAYARYGMSPDHPLVGWLFAAWASDAVATPLVGLMAGVLPQLFPTGRPLGRAWRVPLWAAFAFIILSGIGNALYPQLMESAPGIRNPYAWTSAKPVLAAAIALSAPLGLITLIGSIASLSVRWRRGTNEERQQLRWMLAAAIWLPIPLLLHDTQPVLSGVLLSLTFAGISGAIGAAVLRYRLYDLDLVISRALGYAVVSAMVAGVYLVIVGLAARIVDGRVGLGWQVVATVTAAAAFQPLRTRVQMIVDQVFYGERSRPYDAVAGLARRLEGVPEPDAVLPTIVETVARAMRVPYAAIELPDGDGWRHAAEVGTRPSACAHYPMSYQGETVGRLVVGRRRGDEFSPDDERLLLDLARQAGVAAHATRVTRDLERSRNELVAAVEEERRRLRRDLHDGLGPALAGVTLGLRGAMNRMESEPEDARRRILVIESQIEDVVSDLRQVVYGLRPPALDEFGLVRALELQIANITADRPDLAVHLEAVPVRLPPLPAAAEVAAYRIAVEAVANVVRHAGASRCRIEISTDSALHVRVSDDGGGFASTAAIGVGISAMRERAAEVGGRVEIRQGPGGTTVCATLPLERAS
ncbi:MAG: histidine kinase [Marmoricola sp.]